jgi:hypothetical protein
MAAIELGRLLSRKLFVVNVQIERSSITGDDYKNRLLTGDGGEYR